MCASGRRPGAHLPDTQPPTTHTTVTMISVMDDSLQAASRLVTAPARTVRAMCTLILYRHIVRTGGTSLRASLCQATRGMRQAHVSWAPVVRPEGVPAHCRKRGGMPEAKRRAVASFKACTANENAPGAKECGWAIEYHVFNDGVREFFDDVRNVSAFRPQQSYAPSIPRLLGWPSGGRARALTVVVVREPASWFHSMWLNPEMGHMQWAHLTRSNVTTAILSTYKIKRNPQWRALADASGDSRCPRDDVSCMLGHFDVVGVTARLEETLQLLCVVAQMRSCPTLGHANQKKDVNRFSDGECRRPDADGGAGGCWPSPGPHRAKLLSLIANVHALDEQLHAEAVLRFEDLLRLHPPHDPPRKDAATLRFESLLGL